MNQTSYHRDGAIKEQVFKFSEGSPSVANESFYSTSIKQKFNLTILGKLPQQPEIDQYRSLIADVVSRNGAKVPLKSNRTSTNAEALRLRSSLGGQRRKVIMQRPQL